MQIAVLPPDINASGMSFSVHGSSIRVGLGAVKNVGAGHVATILDARSQEGPFASLMDFCIRTRQINRKVIESLITAGAFDTLGGRAQHLAVLDKVMETAQVEQRLRDEGQLNLFELSPVGAPHAPSITLPSIPELPLRERLMMEKETLGLYISGHPLDDYRACLGHGTLIPLTALAQHRDKRVQVGGMILEVRRITTRKGQEMAFVRVEDLEGSVEVVVFPKVFDRCRSLLQPEQVVLIKGTVDNEDDEGAPKLLADEISVLPLPSQPLAAKESLRVHEGNTQIEGMGIAAVHVLVRSNQGHLLERIKELLAAHPGETPVFLLLTDIEQRRMAPRSHWVTPNPILFSDLRSLLGPQAVATKPLSRS